MNRRDRTIGLKTLRLSAMRMSIAVMLVFSGSQGTAQAETTLILPPEIEAGMVLDADKASLLSILDELATRTGMVIKGRRRITDREINGHYEGDMPVVLKALLKNESYTMILSLAGGQGYTPVEKIIFTRQSERTLVRPARQAVTQTPEKSKAAKVRP